MPNHRKDRINEATRKELALILKDVKDPRLQGEFISVTGADVTPDLKYAKIYYSTLSSDETEQSEIGRALADASGFIRRRLAETLNLRITPELSFIHDNSLDRAARIDSLLRGITSEKSNDE